MRKQFLFLLLLGILCSIGNVWGVDYYTPTADEVVNLCPTSSTISTHAAIGNASGTYTFKSGQTVGNPNGSGTTTMDCIQLKYGNAKKTLVLNISGCSSVILYHNSHSTRYIFGTLTPSVGSATTQKGSASTTSTTITLDGSKSYSILFVGCDGDDETGGDLNVGAVKLIKYTAPSGPSISGAVNPEGYGSVSPSSISVTSGSTVSISGNVLTCDSKTLTATPAVATAEYTYAFVNWTDVEAGDEITSSVTATANFSRTPKSYTLAWNTNGGSSLSGDYTSGTVAFGADITTPDMPTRDSYIFAGWNTKSDGTGDAFSGTMPASNTTYYAKWETIDPALPATTLTLSEPSIPTTGWKGLVTPTYYKADASNVYVFSPYELYQSVSNLTWTTQNGLGSSSNSIDAITPFPASSVFTGFKNATINNKAAAYRITNCKAVYASVISGSDKKRTITLAAYEVNAGVIVGLVKSTSTEANSNTILSLTGLDETKEYYIKVSQVGSGTGGSSGGNSSYFMIGFEADPTPFAPTFSPASGSIRQEETLDVTSGNAAKIYYAWSGTESEPASPESWSYVTTTKGVGSITVPNDVTGTRYLYVYGKNGDESSTISHATYTITAADHTAPSLTDQSIAADATGIAVAGNITLTFDENVQVADASKVTLTGGAATISSVTAADNVVTIAYTGLAFNTTYTLAVASGAITDNAATPNAYTGTSFSFTTMAPKCATPTITLGAFNFANHGYAVTITNNEEGSTVRYSTDNVNWSDYTGTLYATATTHYYAKSVKDSYDDSDVADKNVTNTFDNNKEYIAWAYESNYSGYSFSEDLMATALKTIYNVVEVNAYTTDMSNANLIVLTEAVDGKGSFAKSMKGFVGSTPMINLKFYAYTKGTGNNNRWNWGAPANNAGYYTITPNSALYKVLNGVTFENDGSVKMYNNSPSGNVIQTVAWDNEPTDFPASNTDMGVTNSKVAMHCSNKFFGLGLSCDNKANYSDNAITIIKNAAAMLIAGEALDTEVSSASGSVSSVGWTTFASAYPLDLSTLTSGYTAYVASEVDNGKDEVTLVPCTDIVAANTGLMIKGDAGAFTFSTTNDAATFSGNNLLVGAANGVSLTSSDHAYVLANQGTPDPVLGFYLVNSDLTIPAGKAYLVYNGSLSAPSVIRIVDEENNATNLSNIGATDEAVKFIQDGKLYIKRNGVTYDAMGHAIR